MKLMDIFSYAFGAIRLRKLRAALTTLGVVIGIAAIVALLSLGQGFQDAITMQLQRGFAVDTLIVSPRSEMGMGTTEQSGFYLLVNDTEQIINNVPEVKTVVAVIQRTGYIEVGNISQMVTIVGINFTEYMKIYSTFSAEIGEIPLNPSNDTVILGARVADPWENDTLICEVNDSVELLWTVRENHIPVNVSYVFYVAAILEEIGGFGFGGPSDWSVYIPISTAVDLFGGKCDQIIVQLKDSEEETINAASKKIRELFGDQVSVISSTAILNTVETVFSTVKMFLAGIAGISLLVAGIGIMNIMIVSVMERTREIGILKALGAKNRTIMLIFISEAILIGLIGSTLGIGFGILMARIFSRFGFTGFGGRPGMEATGTTAMTIVPVLTLTTLIGALAFGILVSVLFGLYPAWRAAKLKPVQALRYE